VSRYGTVVALLLLSNCSRDREVLDRFSHSYTSFCDVETDARMSSEGLLFLLDESRQLRTAANRDLLDKKLSVLVVEVNRQLASLDERVSDLNKVANETQTGNYRGEVLEVANTAKEVQVNLISEHRLILRRFNVQERVAEPEKIAKLNREIQEQQASLATAERKCQARFMALKKESGMQEYPLKNRF